MAMLNHKFQETIEKFIRLGSSSLSVSEINADRKFKNNLVDSKQKWISSSNHLSEVDLRFLIKGLVVYDGVNNSYPTMSLGGSVSPIIFLCQGYARRFPEKETELITWVTQHRVNMYLPFGKEN